ncbi:MAG: hypothetical protein QOF21_1840 [Actinomycetota bacterium]
MRIRSLAPIAVAVAIGGALLMPPAATAAQTVTVKPETFAGGAAARALDISVLGTKLTMGDTVANIVKGVSNTGATTLLAQATGTGMLSLLGNTVAPSKAEAAGTSESKTEVCSLPIDLTIITALIGCGASSSAIDANGLMNTIATGKVAGIDLSVNTLLSTLGLDGIVGTVEEALPVGGLVNTLLDVTSALNLPVANIAVDDLLSTVLNSVLKTKTLTVTLGDAVSKVTNTADTVTASAHSSAVDIQILPSPELPLANGTIKLFDKPLLQILIAEAKATATYDRVTGKAVGTPTFDPAIVRIRGVLVDALGLGGLLGSATGSKDQSGDIVLALGQEITLLAGTPLESTIKLGSGKIVDDAVLGQKAVADGVSLQLLKGITLNQDVPYALSLVLAHAEAGAITHLPQTKVLEGLIDNPRSVEAARDLPRTGAETALPLAFAGIAIAAVAIRRYRMAAAAS